MMRFVVWLYLLNKRLLKKPSFVLILALVPLLIGAMYLGAKEDSGVLKIALCMNNPEDEISVEIVNGLQDSNSIIQYVRCDDEEKAREWLTSYEIDAVWVFPKNLKQELENAAHKKRIDAVVTVVEREDTVSLIVSREILCKTLYPFFSYYSYEDFIRDDMGMKEISAEELREAYNRTLVEGCLFKMEYPDGQQVEEANYLLAPIRGVLAVWLVLCGFAASMYFIQDEQKGVFSKVPINNRLAISVVSHVVLLIDAALVLLIGCKMAGVFTQWTGEVLSVILFAGCILVFCNFIRLLCGTMERLGICIPILLMIMLVLCPVFLDFKKFRIIQYLLPPYYYLKSIHSVYYVYGMIIYFVIMGIACVLLSKWQNRKIS